MRLRAARYDTARRTTNDTVASHSSGNSGIPPPAVVEDVVELVVVNDVVRELVGGIDGIVVETDVVVVEGEGVEVVAETEVVVEVELSVVSFNPILAT